MIKRMTAFLKVQDPILHKFKKSAQEPKVTKRKYAKMLAKDVLGRRKRIVLLIRWQSKNGKTTGAVRAKNGTLNL